MSREKTKIEIVLKIALTIANDLMRSKLFKLKRFREQKRFLKNREQKMFDKNFDDVKKLKRLKTMKKVAKKIVDLGKFERFLCFRCFIVKRNQLSFFKSFFFDNNNVVKSFQNF